MAKSKKLLIDMCAGSELKDTQGETLSIEGCDISELEAGRGRFNDNHGKGFFNSLGRVTSAKKIFKAEDCDNDRHSYYWDKIKAPYVYVAGELYNDEDHANAKAAAAILRNIHREDTPLAMKASVEGGVLARGISDPTRLARTKIHSIALTFTPANNATLVEPLNLDKSNSDWEADKQLIKSVMHLAQTNIPSFRHIERHASANTIHDNIFKIQELAKSLGIEIEVKDSSAENIMKNAVYHKISNNINKINKLVKASNMKTVMAPSKPTTTSPGKVAMVAADQKATKLKSTDEFQQKINTLKNNSSTPTRPKNLNTSTKDTSKVQSAAKIKSINTLKTHASKAMRDPEHLNMVHKELVGKGVHPDKATLIINKIKSHIVNKSIIEKGELGNTAKKIVVAGVMAYGATQLNPDKTITVKPKESKQSKIDTHNSKVKDPDKMLGPLDGYDERQPNAKKKFLARRKKLKKSLKKALTAGYGGAGSPGEMTGGSVIQSEGLDDGRSKKSETTDGFSYISCEGCGHEQVHMDHQVKCRECRQNFSLSKLQSHL